MKDQETPHYTPEQERIFMEQNIKGLTVTHVDCCDCHATTRIEFNETWALIIDTGYRWEHRKPQ